MDPKSDRRSTDRWDRDQYLEEYPLPFTGTQRAKSTPIPPTPCTTDLPVSRLEASPQSTSELSQPTDRALAETAQPTPVPDMSLHPPPTQSRPQLRGGDDTICNDLCALCICCNECYMDDIAPLAVTKSSGEHVLRQQGYRINE
ncbi:hypothetical protein OHC33_002065 [Knufia fluminis]|uniref:Uncharacterized protein n=1 Tax=Knufia fluminis TaxID=191047 RepID=A0AAN8EID2_9EURO|nr:hypothetical protein OHC33_002065 [Knufia fluminis]